MGPSALRARFYFISPAPVPQPLTEAQQLELAYWSVAKDTRNKGLIAAYLERALEAERLAAERARAEEERRKAEDAGPVPGMVGNLRWRYLRLDQQASTAVRGRRRRQRHDDGYHDRRFAAPAR